MSESTITKINGRQILDSRGNPTLEVDVHLAGGTVGRAAVPSGASTGKYEAHELRDGHADSYDGKSVHRAVENVSKIEQFLLYQDVMEQRAIDMLMIQKDTTEKKQNLGANAILGVSLAVARVAAQCCQIPLYAYIGQLQGQRREYLLPVPMVNIWNGGSHANWSTDIQEYMIMPVAAPTFSEGVRWCAEVFHALQQLLEHAGYSTTVGDEGGFAPLNTASNEKPLEWMMRAIESKGYRPGEDIAFAIDVAASAFYHDGLYLFDQKNIQQGRTGIAKNACDTLAYYETLKKRFPIISLEDGLSEDDWSHWPILTEKLGQTVQIVGDDLYVTNRKRLEKGLALNASTAIIIKPNQIGTVTETLDTITTAQQSGHGVIVSHRSGETEDTFIAHLAVGAATGQIKTGSLSRGERICKYNELLRIEEQLGSTARYPGKSVLRYCS